MSTIVNAVSQTEDLLECIIKKRKEMIDLGMNYGLLDKKTIQCSQYLDKLISLHMKSHSGSTNMLLDNGASAQLITNLDLATLGAWTVLDLIRNGIATLQIYRNTLMLESKL